jgi:hypothetical protein
MKDNRRNEILDPIRMEIEEIIRWMEENTFAPIQEFERVARRYAVLSVRLKTLSRRY